MGSRSIRGAITVENDNEKDILSATIEMLEKIISKNNLEIKDISSILFTATKDLTKLYPAVAARKLGITSAGLMCVQELYIENSLEKCIRAIVNVESEKAQNEMVHIYLREAKRLREDLIVSEKYYAIAIDGPNGAGKSTIARMVAKELGFIYIDTGAMYRATGYYCIKNNIDLDNHEKICKALDDIKINISYIEGAQRIFLNGEDVTEIIRTQKGANGASKVGVIRSVREKLVSFQQELAKSENVVMDGRDIGTKVLPCADLKIYLDANVEVRAKRRLFELEANGVKTDFETVKIEIMERDERDMNREFSPLRKAEAAVVLDTSNMNIEEVSEEIVLMFGNVST